MRVGIIQSCYLPWRGYFDFIASVDLFLIFDEVQLPNRHDWRIRNAIKTPKGRRWLTVPIARTGPPQRICDTPILTDRPWIADHLALLEEAYASAPHYDRYIEPYRAILRKGHGLLSALNRELTLWLMDELAITTPIESSEPWGEPGRKTARLLSILRAVGATRYLSGPAAADYLDLEAFRASGIGLEYKTYDYAPYPQLWGAFAPAVTVLDLLFNLGSEARHHLRSRQPDTVVLPPAPAFADALARRSS
ncbi:WbqC family protein [Rhodospirillum rubrum]|uniref:WbqC-like protein n=1 Tax=Rhodospirillum rubrum (strain ATCC 11170 / ATH 1.1.1 / DSM 467 / LMG 4362 / NCIMB 8255 / S1) TaxID=269796 RepID=Q2RQQ4_RHORT|nr:WbqC family protein [Rhodospirillum rubrum]ABC23541.1 conserved hypothetical protein [Rhodospirillum rubrum ATCC 11170]AEO49280.1 hypothetical protein F11_14090 [Rhodospirillum rubrum F11]MBK5955215.1 hypothetical protein [Rhodospirillum rubrum]QXG79508.1 WbqC family protein [Rhodospirillum rubrum]HAP98478.1 hypothetical protein [Rhodospirillum rubrum]